MLVRTSVRLPLRAATAACRQELTLVHFSAQPEPFLSLKLHEPPSVFHNRRL
jgi:hypothetical protein